MLLHWGRIFSPFMQMYLTWGPSTWAPTWGCPALFSLILLYISQRSLKANSHKQTSSNSFVFTGNTSNMDREKSSGQLKVKLSHCAVFLLKIWTLPNRQGIGFEVLMICIPAVFTFNLLHDNATFPVKKILVWYYSSLSSLVASEVTVKTFKSWLLAET